MEKTLYDIVKELATKAYNYPNIDMCSDGDIIVYLKRQQKEEEITDEASNGKIDVVRGAGWFLSTGDYSMNVYNHN